MTGPSTGSPAWRETPYDDAWGAFAERFAFRPSFHERERPAIAEPAGSVVLDLSPVFEGGEARFAAGRYAVDAAALRALVWVADEAELLALDWQHPAHRWSPARAAASGEGLRVPVFPDGDYYVHTAPDLAYGTFGHPWQRTLCVWGDPLVDALAADLATWLPVLRRPGAS